MGMFRGSRCRGCSQRGCIGCLSGNLAWVLLPPWFDRRISPARLQSGESTGTKYYTAFPGLWSIPRRKVRNPSLAWMLRIGYHGHPWESMGFGEGFSALPALRGTGFYLPWVGSGTKCEGNTRRKRANVPASLPIPIMIRTHASPAVPRIGSLTEHIGPHREKILLQFPSACVIYHRGIDHTYAY